VAAAARARRARQAEEVRQAYEIVAEELELFGRRRNGRQAARTVALLRARAESLRREELARYARRLQALEPEEREAVERLTSALVAKLCHQPSVALREAASREDGGRLDDAARELFGL
jgi:glutamyl-tRNA reductase